MAWIADTHYEILGGREGMLVRRQPSGAVQLLGVRGRPGFASTAATGGLLYRVEWLPSAAGAGAARFVDLDGVREGGNCLHLACTLGGARQWWCYRPRESDDGTLSLLAEWAPPPERARRRLLPVPSGWALRPAH